MRKVFPSHYEDYINSLFLVLSHSCCVFGWRIILPLDLAPVLPLRPPKTTWYTAVSTDLDYWSAGLLRGIILVPSSKNILLTSDVITHLCLFVSRPKYIYIYIYIYIRTRIYGYMACGLSLSWLCSWSYDIWVWLYTKCYVIFASPLL